MSLFKSKSEFNRLINEYNHLEEEININNANIIQTLNNEDKMMECFYNLKELQNKHPIICTIKEDEQEVRNYLLNILVGNYKNVLLDIYMKNSSNDILKKLELLEKDINGYASKFLSNEINAILHDLHKKIDNYDRYKVRNIGGKYGLSKLSDEEYVKENSTIGNKKVNYNYKLPSIDLLDDESKNIIPIIDKIKNHDKNIMIPLGIENDNIIIESINDMPNLLIGGTVMSGKSSYINTIIGSVLLTKRPSDVKLLIYDSKRIEYSYCNGLPHLLRPVITDSNMLLVTLQTLVFEIEHRYDVFEGDNDKDINFYNEKIDKINEGKTDNEKLLHMSNIIVIIDDYNSLNSNNEINKCIEKIAGYGWKVGVHMIIASNHPSARIIPTISKSNFPARLSFKVASLQSSQAILGAAGAEKLMGYGKALYISKLTGKIIKLAIPYITDGSLQSLVEYCFNEQQPVYSDLYLNGLNKNYKENNDIANGKYDDPLYNDIVEFVVTTGKASASLLQRRFKLGYNRAAKVIDLLEERGIIGPMDRSKPREVLVKINNDNDDEII